VNGLLRQYFHKRTDLRVHGRNVLKAVEDRLNNIHARSLGWQTPAQSSMPFYDDQAELPLESWRLLQ
jgi:IS30 family transposase